MPSGAREIFTSAKRQKVGLCYDCGYERELILCKNPGCGITVCEQCLESIHEVVEEFDRDSKTDPGVGPQSLDGMMKELEALDP